MGSEESTDVVIHLPQSKVAVNSGNFEDVMLEELADHLDELDLRGFCYSGGISVDVEGDDIEVSKIENDEVVGVLFVTFTERLYTGCSDHDIRHHRKGCVDFVLNRETGEAVFSASNDKRGLDRDDPEF